MELPSALEIPFPEKQLRSPISLRSLQSFRFVRRHRVEPFILDLTCMGGGGILFTWVTLSKGEQGKERKNE